MASRIILNAFEMTCVSHQAAGTWRHPDSQAWKYKDLDYWVDLAKLLERGYFDSVFLTLADTPLALGVALFAFGAAQLIVRGDNDTFGTCLQGTFSNPLDHGFAVNVG